MVFAKEIRAISPVVTAVKIIVLTMACLFLKSLDSKAQVVPTPTVIANTICRYPNGVIFCQVSGGQNPYQFSITGVPAIARPAQDNGLFSKLPAGTYRITVTDNNGQSATTAPIVISNTYEPPTLATSKVAPLNCATADGMITINATAVSPPLTYIVDGVVIPSNVATGLSQGDHIVLVQDANRCRVSSQVSFPNTCFTQTPPTSTPADCTPTGSIQVAAPTSAGNFVYKLNVAPYNNYSTNRSFTGLAGGSYMVYTMDQTTRVTSIFSVNVPKNCALPIAPPVVKNSVCNQNNGSITITVSDAIYPLFYTVEGQNYQQSSQPTNTISGLAPGTYTVKVTDANGSASSYPNVVVGQYCPTLTLTSTATGCVGNTGTITATGSGTGPLMYSINGSGFQTSNIFTALAAGDYTVTMKDDNTSITAMATVTTTNGPALTLTGTPTACTANTATITSALTGGAAPFSYQLNGVATPGTGRFAGLGAGVYTVIVTDKNGCTDQQSITIVTTSSPGLTLNPTTATCKGNDATIVANGSGGVLPFEYSIDNTGFSTVNTFNGVSAGDHSVSVRDANGCQSVQTATIQVENNLTVDAGPDMTVCKGQSVTLTGTSNAPTTWSPAGSINDPSLLSVKASPQVTTTYTLQATLGVCIKTDQTTVSVNELPVANAGKNQEICSGQDAQLNGSGGVSYSWSPSSNLNNDHIADPVASGLTNTQAYSLKVTDENGCQSSQPSIVTISVTSIPRIDAGRDTAIVSSVPLILTATDVSNSGFVRYAWSPPTGLNDPSLKMPTAILTTGQTYTVTGFTSAGCTAKDTIVIKVFPKADVFVPNAFTPNNDGVNDVLRVITVGIKELHYFNVYNRLGQMVFTTRNNAEGWDGKISGLSQNTAGFVWEVEAIDYQGNLVRRKGTVLAIR